ncbi:MAG TPA: trypsin-like peptidase domain-containing protein, partial [bacterium]|nr:trypsin-like peptidase domain-containing protein [bacterium]
MKIFIRHQGNIVAEAELEEGKEYTLGRLPESDIRIAQDFISRQHAKIYFSEGTWWYRDLREKKAREMVPRAIADEQAIAVEKGVDLVTPGYLASQRTQEIDAREDLKAFEKQPQEHSLVVRRPFLMPTLTVAFIAVLAVAGFFVYKQWFRPMSATDLLTFVRPKVVEFEETADQEVISQLKKYAKFKDDDFRQSFGFCSGFIVAKNVVLTASHCVFGPYGTDIHENFTIKTHDQKSFQASRILGFDILRDYLYLEVPGLEKYGSLALEPDYTIGERVYTIGNVLGQGIAIREGITASKTKDESDPSLEFLRYSAAASPGNSGGPLVNARGKVIGLVFARSGFSENYNMATDARDLKDGFSRFVDKRDPKKVAIRLDKIPAIFQHDLFGLFAPDSGGAETQKAEAPPPIEVDVPATVADVAKTIGDRMDKFTQDRLKSMDLFGSLFGGKSEGMAEWTLQATDETPLILPYPQYDRINILRVGSDYFIPDAFSLFKPADQASYDLFKSYFKEQNQYLYQARQEEALLSAKDMKALSGGAAPPAEALRYDTGFGGDLKYLDSYYPDITISLNFNRSSDWQAERVPSEEARRKMLLGEKGLLVPSYVSEFVKPDRMRELTLTELPAPEARDVKDDLGRSWSVQTWTLFKDIKITQNCLPLPEGYLCFTRTENTARGRAKLPADDVAESKKLAQVMVEPSFWHVAALNDYRMRGYEKNLNALEDVRMEEAPNGDLQVKLLTMGVSFQIPAAEKPKMVRVVPALYHQGAENKWIAVGF